MTSPLSVPVHIRNPGMLEDVSSYASGTLQGSSIDQLLLDMGELEEDLSTRYREQEEHLSSFLEGAPEVGMEGIGSSAIKVISSLFSLIWGLFKGLLTIALALAKTVVAIIGWLVSRITKSKSENQSIKDIWGEVKDSLGELATGKVAQEEEAKLVPFIFEADVGAIRFENESMMKTSTVDDLMVSIGRDTSSSYKEFLTRMKQWHSAKKDQERALGFFKALIDLKEDDTDLIDEMEKETASILDRKYLGQKTVSSSYHIELEHKLKTSRVLSLASLSSSIGDKDTKRMETIKKISVSVSKDMEKSNRVASKLSSLMEKYSKGLARMPEEKAVKVKATYTAYLGYLRVMNKDVTLTNTIYKNAIARVKNSSSNSLTIRRKLAGALKEAAG